MRPAVLLLALSLFATAGPMQAQETDGARFEPRQVDIAGLIACKGQPEDYMSLALALQDPLNAVALGWRPLPATNMFLSEYALNTPISVFGHRSERIAFAGSSVMAVLDMADPRPLAKELALETAIDTPDKAMFGKELLSEEVHDTGSGLTLVRSVVLNVSNVTSHPGKTLAGCTYSIDPLEEPEGADAPGAVPDPATGG